MNKLPFGETAGADAISGVLAALIKQKNALLAEINQASGYEAALTTQLMALTKSIEQFVIAGSKLQEIATLQNQASATEMKEFMDAVDERIRALSQANHQALVEKAASTLCDPCSAQLRALGHAAVATAPAG